MTHMQNLTTLCGRTSGSCGRIPNVRRCFFPAEGPAWSKCPSKAPVPENQEEKKKRNQHIESDSSALDAHCV